MQQRDRDQEEKDKLRWPSEQKDEIKILKDSADQIGGIKHEDNADEVNDTLDGIECFLILTYHTNHSFIRFIWADLTFLIDNVFIIAHFRKMSNRFLAFSDSYCNATIFDLVKFSDGWFLWNMWYDRRKTMITGTLFSFNWQSVAGSWLSSFASSAATYVCCR